MTIYVDILSYEWFYYYYDSDGYKNKVEGFGTHLSAESHAKERFGNDIDFIYNR